MKKDIILVQYTGFPTTMSNLILDNGLASLAAYVKPRGFEAIVLDFNTTERIKILRDFPKEKAFMIDVDRVGNQIQQCIRETGCKTIGFKLWTGNAYRMTSLLIQRLRSQVPGLTIIGGGPHVDYYGTIVMEHNPGFDYLIRGEGEEPLLKMLEFLRGDRKDISSVPNLIYQDGNEIKQTRRTTMQDMDQLAIPCYDPDVYFPFDSREKVKIAILEMTRGCGFSCHFCGHGNKSGKKIRHKSTEKIIAEIETIQKKHGINVFRSGDSNTPSKVAYDVARSLIDRNIRIEYTLLGRADTTRVEHLETIRKSGCFSQFFGVESGSQYLLDKAFNKHTKAEQVGEKILAVKQAGMKVITSIIMPAPFETEQTIEESFDFVKKYKPDTVTICLPILNPNTQWGDYPDQFGIELETDFFVRGMDFTVTLLYSVDEWQESSYRMNGRSTEEIRHLARSFEDRLEKEGFLTQVIDDVALMAKCAGQSMREFRDNTRTMFKNNDYDQLVDLTLNLNSYISTSNQESGQPNAEF